MNNKEYVKKYLEPAFTMAGSSIKALDYVENDKPYIDEKCNKHYYEEIVITYNNGYQRVVNVECDSQLAIMEDVLRNGHVF